MSWTQEKPKICNSAIKTATCCYFSQWIPFKYCYFQLPWECCSLSHSWSVTCPFLKEQASSFLEPKHDMITQNFYLWLKNSFSCRKGRGGGRERVHLFYELTYISFSSIMIDPPPRHWWDLDLLASANMVASNHTQDALAQHRKRVGRSSGSGWYVWLPPILWVYYVPGCPAPK